MNTSTKILIGLIVVAAIAVGAMSMTKGATAPAPRESEAPADQANGSGGRIMAATVEDGEYYVLITEVASTSDDVGLTMKHVSYFTGPEARLSAEKEVDCKGRPITTCVPTLEDGYYVRISGAPEFTAPLASDATISLSSKLDTVAGLSQWIAINKYLPIFTVTVKEGKAVRVREVTGWNQ